MERGQELVPEAFFLITGDDGAKTALGACLWDSCWLIHSVFDLWMLYWYVVGTLGANVKEEQHIYTKG